MIVILIKQGISILLFVLLLPLIIFLNRKGTKIVSFLLTFMLPFMGVLISINQFLLVCIVGILLNKHTNLGNSFRYSKLLLIMCLYLGYTLITSFVVENITPAIEQMLSYLKIVVYFLLLLIVVNSNENTYYLVKGLLYGFIVSITIQFLQFLGVTEFYLYSLDQLNDNTGIVLDVKDIIIRYWGPFGNALTFSNYLATVGIFLFSIYFGKRPTLTILIFFLTTLSISLTAGRAAFLSWGIGVTILLLVRLRIYYHILIVLMLIIIFYILGDDIFDSDFSNIGILARYATSSSDFKNARFELWQKGFKLFYDNPLFGTGIGNLNTGLSRYLGGLNSLESVKNYAFGHIENTYLTVLLTYGIVGLCVFLLYLSENVLLSFKLYRTTFSGLSIGILLFWLTMAINMIVNPAYIIDIRITLLTIIFSVFNIKLAESNSKEISKF